jgi:hypothetical protein
VLIEYLRGEQRIGRVTQDVNVDTAATVMIGACLQRAFFGRLMGESFTEDEDERFIKDTLKLLMRTVSPRRD